MTETLKSISNHGIHFSTTCFNYSINLLYVLLFLSAWLNYQWNLRKLKKCSNQEWDLSIWHSSQLDTLSSFNFYAFPCMGTPSLQDINCFQLCQKRNSLHISNLQRIRKKDLIQNLFIWSLLAIFKHRIWFCQLPVNWRWNILACMHHQLLYFHLWRVPVLHLLTLRLWCHCP